MSHDELKTPDESIKLALKTVRFDADLSSDLNGSSSRETIDLRRVETTFVRLAREAGYDLSEIEGES